MAKKRPSTSRPSPSSSRQSRENTPEEKRGFVFVDRSGKVHGTRQRKEAQQDDETPDPLPVYARLPEPNVVRHTEDSFLDYPPRQKKKKTPGRGPSDRRSFKDRTAGRASQDKNRKKEKFKGRKKDHREISATPPRTQRQTEALKARVDKNRKGFGFLIFDDRSIEDIFVPPRLAETLFHGDRVEVQMNRFGEVTGMEVIEHRFREIVGRYWPHPDGQQARGGWLVYERKKAREQIHIPASTDRVQANDWIRAKLHFDKRDSGRVHAEVIEVYGQDLPPSADMRMVAGEFNLVEKHSPAAIKEAESHKLDLEDPHRTDLREVPFITIDGETARDFDDAVYVERNKSGYILWVAIADVSHYVTVGSELDKEARSRGTSVYFPERAFHMLPSQLSENLCSLRPHEPRLSFVAKMEFDFKGKRTRVELIEALIESKRRATYNEIQSEYEAEGKKKNWEYAPHFELFHLLRKQRIARGSMDFDLPEAELNVEPSGEVISIKKRDRLFAHQLIEDFMIAANEAVTDWVLERKWPFIYRVHEEPSFEKLSGFQKVAKTQGVVFRWDAENTARSLSAFLKKIQGHPAEALLNSLLLRSMKQAIYQAEHGGHFGLASEGYTHFTSPIRRYPDLVVHRILRQALRVQNKIEKTLSKKEVEALEKELASIAEHCSYRERIAADAERESIKLKQVRAIEAHIGSEFKGKIVGIMEGGFFVEITDPYVEGFVSVDTLHDDYYVFQEEKMTLTGRRKKRVFRIGDPVEILVAKANIDRRQIEFELKENSTRRQNPPN